MRQTRVIPLIWEDPTCWGPTKTPAGSTDCALRPRATTPAVGAPRARAARGPGTAISKQTNEKKRHLGTRGNANSRQQQEPHVHLRNGQKQKRVTPSACRDSEKKTFLSVAGWEGGQLRLSWEGAWFSENHT